MLQVISPIAIILGVVALLFNGLGGQTFEKLSQIQDFSDVYNFVLGFEDGVMVEEQSQVRYNEFGTTGFWESYRGPLKPGKGNATVESYYYNDIEFFDNIIYSFITLDQHPDPEHPRHMQWDGNCLYDSTTKDCAYDTFECADPSGDPAKGQAAKVCPLYKAIKDNGKKFLLGIGGESDLTGGLTLEQIPKFASQVVELCRIACDGINMDFEHMSEMENRHDQYKMMAHLLHHTRDALNNTRDIGWKPISYSLKYNALLNDTNRPKGYTKFASDGELLYIDQILRADFGQNLTDVISAVNIMFYDQPGKDINAPDGLKVENFQEILTASSMFYPHRQMHMGFEPGPQANGGKWEGMDIDKQVVDFMRKEPEFGGAYFWTINNPATGNNSQAIAQYITES